MNSKTKQGSSPELCRTMRITDQLQVISFLCTAGAPHLDTHTQKSPLQVHIIICFMLPPPTPHRWSHTEITTGTSSSAPPPPPPPPPPPEVITQKSLWVQNHQLLSAPTHTHECTHTCTQTHAHTHACMHAHKHTHIHTYTHHTFSLSLTHTHHHISHTHTHTSHHTYICTHTLV